MTKSKDPTAEAWTASEVKFDSLLQAICRIGGLDTRCMDARGVDRREEFRRRIERVFPGLHPASESKPTQD